jgi:hypothetical protein
VPAQQQRNTDLTDAAGGSLEELGVTPKASTAVAAPNLGIEAHLTIEIIP